ncbi:MAG: hypothetical protein CMN30_33800 [Sandaracinus sp.]|nr:hypothetical protein [Sandaracinus sp.]|tara:strand:- start:1499 stop:2140 length:642 start_codon:yes stop_codon:yes gene_type:complete
MRCDAHESLAPAEVRGRSLGRHGIARLDGNRAFVVSTGIGWPRSWGITRRHVLEGFERGLTANRSAEPRDRLRFAMGAARQALVDLCDALVERDVPDAGLVALVIGAGAAHVATVGDGRVYLHRRGSPQRLTPRDQPAEGLVDGEVVLTEAVLDPEDLLLMGSASAFSEAAINRVGGVLQSDPHAPPAALANLLTEPARRAGVGAAAVAIRVG